MLANSFRLAIRRRIIGCCCLMGPVLQVGAIFADGVAETKQTVHVGIYVNQIPALSLKDNQFEVDFTIWFRGYSDDFDPLETFEVVDGQVESRTGVTKTKIGDENYSSCRIAAKVTQFWNVSRFPLDDHTLRIAIEDGSNEEFRVRYVGDGEYSGLSQRIQVPGWKLGEAHTAVTSERYNTNYGDTSLPRTNESAYSRFTYSVNLIRPDWGYFLKLFTGLFVAAAIAFLAFCIKPGEARFGLGAGAIFAAVASQYISSSNLPNTNILTMADLLHILAFVFIFLSLAESTAAMHLFYSGSERKIRLARRIDWWSVIVLGGTYAGMSAWAVFRYGA